jgi:hypothetical protein
MHRLPLVLTLTCLITPALATEGSRAQAAHEHGAAQLDIALSGSTLELQLEGATFNFVGFERAPESAEEVARVDAAKARLGDGSTLYALPSAAACVAGVPRVQAELPQPASASVHDHDHADHDHAHDEHQHVEHADGHAHAEHSHDDAHAGHSNWRSYHRFDCAKPQALNALTLSLFAHFPELQHIDYQLVTDTTQTGGRLTPADNEIPLSR